MLFGPLWRRCGVSLRRRARFINYQTVEFIIVPVGKGRFLYYYIYLFFSSYRVFTLMLNCAHFIIINYRRYSSEIMALCYKHHYKYISL